jgi:hypothetical protein
MSYELVYEGKIESAERTETGNWRVRVHLKPWCIDCRKATYECAHLSPKSEGIMYFTLGKKPEAGYLRYYAERQPTRVGSPLR